MGDDGGSRSLIEQWNGSGWSVVASADLSTNTNVPRGVAVVTATDIWAVGDFVDNTTFGFDTLLEQWNGTSWSAVITPNPSSSRASLNGAAADPSSGQAWAVGSDTTTGQSLIEFNP